VKAENKEVPKIVPEKLTAEINEEYSGVIEFINTTITVSDRDSVSTVYCCCHSRYSFFQLMFKW
jgi:hypothetical protein